MEHIRNLSKEKLVFLCIKKGMRFKLKIEYTLYLKIKNLSKKKLTKKLACFFFSVTK